MNGYRHLKNRFEFQVLNTISSEILQKLDNIEKKVHVKTFYLKKKRGIPDKIFRIIRECFVRGHLRVNRLDLKKTKKGECLMLNV